MKAHGAMYRNIITGLLLAAAPAAAVAEWAVITRPGTDNSTTTRVAHTVNKDGYSLEIYRDTNNVIRIRFGMNKLDRLNGKNCPTYQIDNHRARNRSINDAQCLSQNNWAEYVLGYLNDDQVTSTSMLNLMNGNTITYRFILQDYSYSETSFSLAGSKRILQDVLGKNLAVSTEKDLP